MPDSRYHLYYQKLSRMPNFRSMDRYRKTRDEKSVKIGAKLMTLGLTWNPRSDFKGALTSRAFSP